MQLLTVDDKWGGAAPCFAVRLCHRDLWQMFKPYHYLDAKLNTSARYNIPGPPKIGPTIHSLCRCFAAVGPNGGPVAFVAVLSMLHRSDGNAFREHRLVVLPDYQVLYLSDGLLIFLRKGFGIGPRLSEAVAHLYKRRGFRSLKASCVTVSPFMHRYYSKTAHPRLIEQRNRCVAWLIGMVNDCS